MRKVENEQMKSVLFDGQNSEQIISLRREMDERMETICSTLQKAYDVAETALKELGLSYEPKFQEILAGTDLENVPLDQIVWDYSKAGQHGFVFAQKVNQSPIEVFLNVLRRTTENGPGAIDGSGIFIEERSPSFQKIWGSDVGSRTRQEEHA